MGSIEELLVRRALDASPLSRALEGGGVDLPSVPAPSLEKLSVKIEIPKTLSGLDVTLRALARKLGKQTKRKPGEIVEWGDEVHLDLLAYSGGDLVPGTVRSATPFVLGEDDLSPQLQESVVGVPVGHQMTVPAPISDQHPLARLRGQPAMWAVHVLEAKSFKPLDLEDPKLIKKTGSASLAELKEKTIEDMSAQAGSMAFFAAYREVMQELVKRAKVSVTDRLIDHAIGAEWLAQEGAVLAQWNVDVDQREKVLRTWLAEPEVREDTRQRVASTLVMTAIAERDGVYLRPQHKDGLIKAMMQATGLPRQKIVETMRGSDGPKILQGFNVFLLMRYIMSQVDIQTV